MEKWEELFPQNTRKKGRELLENGRIRELSVNENEYSAAVLGRERYEVKISMDHGVPGRTRSAGRWEEDGRGAPWRRCCMRRSRKRQKRKEKKAGRSRRKRRHTPIWMERRQTGAAPRTKKKAIRMLQGYRYFHGDQIRKSPRLSTEAETGGRKAISGGRLRLEQVGKGFERSGGQVLGQASAIGETERGEEILLSGPPGILQR